MIQTAEGAMSVIDEKLIRMKELAEQAATGTYTTAQREIMNSEYQAMAAEIDRIATATDFNGVKLLDGSLEALHSGSGLKVHFGTGNSSSEDYYYVSIGDMRATQEHRPGFAGTATSVGLAIAAYINANDSDLGVHSTYTTSSGALNVFAYEGGAAGNSIETVTGSTYGIEVSQAALSGGGETPLTASAYYDEANEEWELQIQMNHGGEKYQAQIFSMKGTVTGTTAPSIVGGLISGTDMDGTGGSQQLYGVLPTNLTTNAVTYGSLDEVDEWAQPQNGAGTTEWAGADILTQSGAQEALAAMDVAINKKDTARANLGAIQNRLENTITNLQIQAENLQAAESRISDVDVATEMTEFTRNNILAQAATAMLAQANSLPQLALQLLG
jgi:flagellin